MWGSHNYTQCNFDKRDEVTCCPNTSNMTTMTATAASTSTTKKPVLGTEFREPDIARKSDQSIFYLNIIVRLTKEFILQIATTIPRGLNKDYVRK